MRVDDNLDWAGMYRQVAEERDRLANALITRQRLADGTEPQDKEDQTLTVVELAQRWRVCRQSITAMIREGRLQAFRVGKRPYRIKEAEVIRYEQQNLAVAS